MVRQPSVLSATTVIPSYPSLPWACLAFQRMEVHLVSVGQAQLRLALTAAGSAPAWWCLPWYLPAAPGRPHLQIRPLHLGSCMSGAILALLMGTRRVPLHCSQLVRAAAPSLCVHHAISAPSRRDWGAGVACSVARTPAALRCKAPLGRVRIAHRLGHPQRSDAVPAELRRQHGCQAPPPAAAAPPGPAGGAAAAQHGA